MLIAAEIAPLKSAIEEIESYDGAILGIGEDEGFGPCLLQIHKKTPYSEAATRFAAMGFVSSF